LAADHAAKAQGTIPEGDEETMKSGEVKQLTTKAIEDLASAMRAGRTDELTHYLAAMSRFHRYSLHNVMLIVLQKPMATHVAGFHTWNKLGRHVRKSEKGILIFAPIARKKEAPDAELDPPEREVCGFRGCAVFDYSQTEGQELPTIGRVEGDPSGFQERLKQFVAAQGIALAYSGDIAPAKGISEGGKITILPGMSPAESFATLVHECAHELLHRAANRKETSKPQRETEAEAVAFVVCRGIGLDTGTACQNYIQLYQGDSALLMESLERVQSAASRILGYITE
jgi:antirestriction protein ArdC